MASQSVAISSMAWQPAMAPYLSAKKQRNIWHQPAGSINSGGGGSGMAGCVTLSAASWRGISASWRRISVFWPGERRL